MGEYNVCVFPLDVLSTGSCPTSEPSALLQLLVLGEAHGSTVISLS